MKKAFVLFCSIFFVIGLYAQTSVTEKNLGKTLEKNKEANAIFESYINLNDMRVLSDGKVILPLLAKSKISLVSEMDMTEINKRIAYARKNSFKVIIITKDLQNKTYAITDIEGIESYDEYKNRLAAEAEKERLANLTKQPVQVILPETVNVSAGEASWLPGQVQDKIKENLQTYFGMRTTVDSEAERKVKKLQAESESAARDEKYAIEIGKITTAKFGLFSKVRKTGSGYSISLDFIDLTSGEVMASCSSKEYSKSEYLYGSTGAVDELTIVLADKLGIKINELNMSLLTKGSGSLSFDEEQEIVKQNERRYQKMLSSYDEELARLSKSNDINAIQNQKRIEAEKALLLEKQEADRIRQEELNAQKARSVADEKLEAERSIALKTQRDQMAKQAAEKAAEVRKLKFEKQGVLGQINVIESKKKALVEIWQSVEERQKKIYNQLIKDRKSEEEKIKNKAYSTVELGSDGNPTETALKRRSNQIGKSYDDLTNKFFADAESIRKSVEVQETALISEIRADQKALAATRTVSSMGEELKVSFGSYEGIKNGWNAYLSLYSEGVLLYTDNFIVNYEALSGKKAPDMENELDDSVIEEYTNMVDMYSSLLVRGDPILYFELEYNVIAEADDKPSEYKFNFNKIRVINTVSGKTVQTAALNKVIAREVNPKNDLRIKSGVVDKEKEKQNEIALILQYGNFNNTYEAIQVLNKYPSIIKILKDLKQFPNSNFMVMDNCISVKTLLEIMETEKYWYKFNEKRCYIYIPERNEYYCGDPGVLLHERGVLNEVSQDDNIYVTPDKIPEFCNKLNSILGLQNFYLKPDKYPNTFSNDSFVYNVNDESNGFRMPYDEHFYIPKDGIIRKYIKDKDWYKGKVWTDAPKNNIVHFYWFNIDGRRVERFDTNDFYFTREIQLAIPIKNKK